MNREWADILRELEQKGVSDWTRVLEGKTYRRRFERPERLILLGGGHVAQAVAVLAPKLQYTATVVDDRPDFANHTLFPDAETVICDAFPAAVPKLSVCARDSVCVLTRGHRWDADCLRAVLKGEMPGYLGMIGSRRRAAALMETLRAEGYDPEKLEQIHTPIGLPIHAQTPAEIAVSIAAELIQVRRSRPAARDILERTDTDEAMLRFLAGSDAPRALLMALETSGPAPVAPGAMMALDRAGRSFGTVGGGCAEGEAMAKARNLMGSGQRAVLSLDLSGDFTREGMVCGGSMKILVEDIPG